jgi:2-polyprenyl-3-methyl-5-hydroxy-6-metoxy-1,4-benzoquinol methylase
MSSDELDNFYAREYRQTYQNEEGPTPKDVYVQDGRAEALLDFLNGKLLSAKLCLDIGCSTGILLERLRNHFGCELIGVEPGDAYREHAKSKGLTVYAKLEDLPSKYRGSFDLVSMVHVLEHVPNPVAYLHALRERYLSSSGWLLLEVPNLYAHDSFEIAHTVAFSEHTLRQIQYKARFDVADLRKHGRPRSKLLPLYLTSLARPKMDRISQYKVQPEGYVALKRRAGMLRRRLLQRLLPKWAWVPLARGS